MANRLQVRPIRAIVGCASRLDGRQLGADLARDPSLSISAASNAADLWKQIEQEGPDAILLDLDLAEENTPGLIRDLLKNARIPTLLRAGISGASAGLLSDCLEAGALAVIGKPGSISQSAETLPDLIWQLRAAANASIANLLAIHSESWPAIPAILSDVILALGGGMGSLPALTGILSQLPVNAPGAVVIAPLPAALLADFADRVSARCRMRVKLAAYGDLIKPGQILIAPGDSHLLVRRSVAGFTIALKPGPAVFHQKPSIDMLLGSIADTAGGDAIGVLLGGAGVDGVVGLLSVRNRGGSTIAESPGTSVLVDVPNRATACNAADAIEPAEKIAVKMMEFAAERQSSRAA